MFIFYDTETSGLEKEFSQILQIALVFTDDNMNILSSKKLECRRSPWVVPAPGALLTTGFTPDDLKNGKYSHYEMMHEVNEWVRSQYWPLITAGYNNIGYDEPLLAHNLHQNLLPPDLTTETNPANGQMNGRFDVMIMVKAVAMYMPGLLKLDTKNDFGTVSLSLTNVAEQNGVVLSAEDAHDAMNDIKATVGLAKLLKKAAPELWDHMITLSTTTGVDDFLAKNQMFTYSYMVYGRTYATPATSVAGRAGDDAQYVFNLAVDPAKYMAMTVDELADCLTPDNIKNSPFKTFHRSEQPILVPIDKSDAVLNRHFDEKLYAARADAIQNNAQFRANVAAAAEKVRLSQPAAPAKMPEQQLGHGPADPALRARLDGWIKDFNATATWAEAAALVQDFYKRFDANDLKAEPGLRRYVKFAGRIVFEHAPDELPAEKQELMKRHIAARLLNPDLNVPYMTIAKARKELETIVQERNDGKSRWQGVTETQIRALKLYYTALEKEYAPYHPGGNTSCTANDNGTAAETPRKPASDGFKPAA